MADTSAAAKPEAGKPETKATEAEHPLQTGWTLWYDKKLPRNDKSVSYKDNLRQLGSFNTVEGFWRHYVHLKRPSELPDDVNLYCFREGALPMWEEFPNGGCWIVQVKKHSGVLSKMWQDLLFGAIGELFEEPNVVGVTLALRRQRDILSVWNHDNSNAAVRFHVGECLKRILGLDPSTLIEYKNHSNSMHDKSTYAHAQKYVFAPSRKSSVGSAREGGEPDSIPEHAAQ